MNKTGEKKLETHHCGPKKGLLESKTESGKEKATGWGCVTMMMMMMMVKAQKERSHDHNLPHLHTLGAAVNILWPTTSPSQSTTLPLVSNYYAK